MARTIDRQVQQDFSAGMFRSVDPALIPPNGAYDIVGLLEEDGAVSGRGGSGFRSSNAMPGTGEITFIWNGWLTAGRRTLVWSNSDPPNQMAVLTTSTLSFPSLAGISVDALAPPAVIGGKAYFAGGWIYDGTTWTSFSPAVEIVAAAGNRLWKLYGDRLDFSNIGDPATFSPTDFHKIPEGLQFRGAVGFRDSLLVFTTGGVFRFSGIASNLTDAAGNVQHRVDHLTREMILVRQSGIAAWEGGLVVPALDGIWLVRTGVEGEALAPFERISDPIAPYYRSKWRAAGGGTAVCGQGAIHRGHYFLPVPTSAGSSTYEILVCRLDSPRRPWSRLTGQGANTRALVSMLDDSGIPILVGGDRSGARKVLDLFWFDPSSAHSTDHDGSDTDDWQITTRDFPTGALNFNTVAKLRAAYELEDPAAVNPTITASYAVGDTDSSFTALAGSAPEDPSALTPYSWHFAKRARQIRFKLQASGRYAKLKLRSLEVFTRPSGRV